VSLDNYEPRGREFESLRARYLFHISQRSEDLQLEGGDLEALDLVRGRTRVDRPADPATLDNRLPTREEALYPE
jgi:hypothetical protein